jgi:hypothetical protein
MGLENTTAVQQCFEQLQARVLAGDSCEQDTNNSFFWASLACQPFNKKVWEWMLSLKDLPWKIKGLQHSLRSFSAILDEGYLWETLQSETKPEENLQILAHQRNLSQLLWGERTSQVARKASTYIQKLAQKDRVQLLKAPDAASSLIFHGYAHQVLIHLDEMNPEDKAGVLTAEWTIKRLILNGFKREILDLARVLKSQHNITTVTSHYISERERMIRPLGNIKKDKLNLRPNGISPYTKRRNLREQADKNRGIGSFK